MAENDTEQGQRPDEAKLAEIEERNDWYDREHLDWSLQMIVGICNVTGLEIPITLNLRGAYVSGHIVKPEVYFDGLKADLQRATFNDSPGNDVRKAMENLISGMRSIVAPVAEAKDASDKDGARSGLRSRAMSPRFIHLRRARFFVPNDVGRALNPQPGLWWKGKIAAVDGFFLGMPFD